MRRPVSAGPGRADAPQRERRSRDQALVLPLIGALLLLPPVAGIFRLGGTVAGVPVTLACVFAIWALLIAGAAVLARRLDALPEERGDGGSDG